MKITPLDMRRQEFGRKMRGIDPDEVETFLEMVADEFEAVIKENTTLRDRISGLDSQVATFREMEKTQQETILTAQKARDEAKSEALKQAEFIIREAELKAERWIEEARQEVVALRRELATLKGHKASFIAKLRSLLNSQSELLNILELDEEELLQEKRTPPAEREQRGEQGETSTDERSSSTVSAPTGRSSADGRGGETFRHSGSG